VNVILFCQIYISAYPKLRGESYIDKGKRGRNRAKLEYVNTVEIRRLKKNRRDRALSTIGGLNPAFDHCIQIGNLLSFSEI